MYVFYRAGATLVYYGPQVSASYGIQRRHSLMAPVQVLFEVVIFIMVVWNALCQPRKKEQAMSILYRDGVFYFVVCVTPSFGILRMT